MSVFPQSGARDLESFIWLKYYIYRNSNKKIFSKKKIPDYGTDMQT